MITVELHINGRKMAEQAVDEEHCELTARRLYFNFMCDMMKAAGIKAEVWIVGLESKVWEINNPEPLRKTA
jgi:hypothetical protein